MTVEEAALEAFAQMDNMLRPGIARFSFEYDRPGVITAVVEDPSSHALVASILPSQFRVDELGGSGRSFDFSIHIEIGPGVRTLLATDEDGIEKSELANRGIVPTLGGDPCFVTGDTSYGTAGIYARTLTIEAITRVGKRYVCGGIDVFLTCNHVIADLDRNPTQTPLVTGSQPGQVVDQTAILGCAFPLNDIDLNMDLALGVNVTPPENLTGGEIRGIGEVNATFRRPSDLGERIRKHGARTGLTAGRNTGRALIYAPGSNGNIRQYNGLYQTTPGFSCPGDSGSIVVADNLDVLGMIAWGERKDCSAGPIGYFFTLAPNGTALGDEALRVHLGV